MVDLLSGGVVDHRDAPLFTIIVRITDSERIDYVRDSIIDEIDRLKIELVDSSVLADTKSHMRYTFAMGLDNPSSIAEMMGHYLQLTESPETVNRVYQLYNSVSPKRYSTSCHHLFLRDESNDNCASTGRAIMLEQIQRRTFVFLVCLVVFSCGPSERLEHNSSTDKGSDSSFVWKPVELFVPGDPLINFHIAFRTGAIDDPVRKDGLNALTALMVVRGGTQTISYEEITKMLYSWSASITVQSDKEMTTIVGHVHRDYLEPFYEILRDLIISPGFNESDFQRNKDFLTNAIVSTLRGNNDEELGKQALNTLMYQGHSYGVPEIGTEMGLGAITLDDVRAFYGRQYTRDNLLVGIAGGYPSGFGDRVALDIGGPNGITGW